MDPNGNGKDEAPTTFRIEIDLSLEHMELPAEFYQMKKNELGKEIELKDPMGNTVDVQLIRGKRVFLWHLVGKLVDIYGLNENHFMDFVHAGGNKFKIEIFDGNMNQIPYEPKKEVAHVFEKEIAESSTGEVATLVSSEITEPKEVEAHVFESEIADTSIGEVAKLYVPRHFVKDYVNKEWKNLLIQPEGGGFYVCKLMWRKRNGEKYYCHLGDEWGQFVRDKNLVEGDKVIFESVCHDYNIVTARIVRKQIN